MRFFEKLQMKVALVHPTASNGVCSRCRSEKEHIRVKNQK